MRRAGGGSPGSRVAVLRDRASASPGDLSASAGDDGAAAAVEHGDRGARRWSPGHWPLTAVLVIGLLARAVLVPITHGPDFAVWDLASGATLRGVNVYAHHPPYAGGPYSYFPLFLYLELPMQWIAGHTGIPFTITGKLPVMVADVVVAAVLAGEVARRGRSEAQQAIAAGIFFLNPLVLYNGAFYGRFDSVCIALLLVAVRIHRSDHTAAWRFGSVYGLSVAAKTFPIFIVPWFLRRYRGGVARVLVACAAVLVAISAPYLVTSPRSFITDLLYVADKLSGGLSWQVVLHGMPEATQLLIADILLLGFALVALALAYVDDVVVYCAVIPLTFVVLSKYVIEQYLTWPIAFLAVLAVDARSRPAALLLAAVTVAGMVVNPYIHPFGEQPAALNAVLAGVIVGGVARLLMQGSRRGSGPPHEARIQPRPATMERP